MYHKNLNKAEIKLLNKELNFGLSDKKIVNLDFIKSAEIAAPLLPSQSQDLYRSYVKSALDRHKPSQSNLTAEPPTAKCALEGLIYFE
jgi:hypothetical protein